MTSKCSFNENLEVIELTVKEYVLEGLRIGLNIVSR